MLLPKKTRATIESLRKMGVEPILYGSQGISIYIGPFKQFGDIDLLVEARWIEESWQSLIAKMGSLGFTLTDEHEHEFIDHEGTIVAFASCDILVRDKITESVHDAIQTQEIDGTNITTLKPEAFLNAYEFSARDGYRKGVRNKKDSTVIELINNYLKKVQGQ